MNKSIERIILAGGIVSLFWAVFHALMIPMLVTEMAADAGGVSMPGVEALVSFILLCNACLTAFFLGIGVALIVGRKTVDQTLFGKLTLTMMVVFWMVRLLTPYFLLSQGVSPVEYLTSFEGTFDLVFVLMIVLFVLPLILRKKAKGASDSI